jgi:hypothetical protein
MGRLDMNRFTLFHDDGDAKIEMNFEEVGLENVLEKIDRFIKAAGFLPKGELEYVEEDTVDGDSDVLQRKLNSIERRVEDARIEVQAGRLNHEEMAELIHKILTDIYA